MCVLSLSRVLLKSRDGIKVDAQGCIITVGSTSRCGARMWRQGCMCICLLMNRWPNYNSVCVYESGMDIVLKMGCDDDDDDDDGFVCVSLVSISIYRPTS